MNPSENLSKNSISQAGNPRGFKGRILARIMGIVHRNEFKAVASTLEIGTDDDYLELGCGAGIFMHQYASQAGSVAGLDHSGDMVALAAQFNRKRVAGGTARFKKGDVAALPWPDHSFSAAAAIATFMFWPDPVQALREIHRVLSPGGRLVVSLGWNAEDGKDHSRHIKKYGIKLYNSNDMTAMCRKAGFTRTRFSWSRGFMMPRLMVVSAEK